MCGICGEVRFGSDPADVAAVDRMAASMVRRGPDGAGLVARGRVAFGHRRLKIIDLSEAAQQPMVDAELGLSIAYNGAIYNYAELRQELARKGYRFFSTGDTEVILKAYHAWGIDCVAVPAWQRKRGVSCVQLCATMNDVRFRCVHPCCTNAYRLLRAFLDASA